MKVVELFAGIGAQRMALILAGIPHEVTAISEIDKHALASYQAIYGDCPNMGDISKINSLPECDLVTWSFPCTDLSIAGKRAGMGEGTRSGLAWHVLRLLDAAGERERPEWLLMENVPQVLTAPEWPEVVRRLEAMGYRNKWGKLDSSRFGSAQKRVRAFMVSRLDREPPDLPESDPCAPALCLRDVMEPERPERFVRRIPMDRIRWRNGPETGSDTIHAGDDTQYSYDMEARIMDHRGKSPSVVNGHGVRIQVVGDWQRAGRDCANRIYSSSSSSCPTLCGQGGGNRDIKVLACADDNGDLDQNIVPSKTFLDRRYYDAAGSSPAVTVKEGRNIKIVAEDTSRGYGSSAKILSSSSSSSTLRAQVHGLQNQPKVLESEDGGDLIVSVLTPRECWRLMGFPEWAYLRASRVCSETQLYNQAGNSIVVEVLQAIFRTMFSPWVNPQKTLGEWCRWRTIRERSAI